MKNLFITICFSFFIINATAQKKCNAIAIKAFATTVFPGMIQVDSNGNEVPQKQTFFRKIFLSTTCNKKPEIKSVLYNRINTINTINKIDAKSIEVGFNKNGTKQIIECIKTNFLWEIDVNENSIEPNQIKSIIVNCLVDKKPFILQFKEINIVPLVMPN